MKYDWDYSNWGKVVYPTAKLVSQGLAEYDKAGLLLGEDGNFVRVVREDTVTSIIYWKGFWIEEKE